MRLQLLILSLATAISAFCQDELPDSVGLPPRLEADQLADSTNIYSRFDRLYSELTMPAFKNELRADSSRFSMAEIDTDFTPGVAQIAGWQNGRIYASGGRQEIPGLMGIESGSLNVEQSFGRLSVSAFGSAIKYGFFRGLETSYGFGGALSYRFSDRVSATLFGEYYTSVGLNQIAMIGYANASRFGGYIDYSISNHFGVEVGAQGYRSMINRRIEAQPIVKPYFKLSKNAKIGVDVGGIMYQILKGRHSDYNGKNLTIGPPVQKLSQAMGY